MSRYPGRVLMVLLWGIIGVFTYDISLHSITELK